MALQFPYRRVQLARPALTLNGAGIRFRPLVDLSITGPTATVARLVLVDPGADEIILPESDAALVGIDLAQATAGTGQGVGSIPLVVRYAPVVLRLSDGGEFLTWPAIVGFTTGLRDRGLLGMAQGLRYFTTIFDGEREEVRLEINGLYPGS